MGKKVPKVKSITKIKNKSHKQKVKSHKKNKSISKTKHRTKLRSESQDKLQKPEAPLTNYLAYKSNYIAVRYIFECGMFYYSKSVCSIIYMNLYLYFMNRYKTWSKTCYYMLSSSLLP